MGDMADFIMDSESHDENLEVRQPFLGVRCKYCNKGYFQWRIEDDGKWRLYDEGKPHVCDMYEGKR